MYCGYVLASRHPSVAKYFELASISLKKFVNPSVTIHSILTAYIMSRGWDVDCSVNVELSLFIYLFACNIQR